MYRFIKTKRTRNLGRYKKDGAILENIVFKKNSNIVDFTNGSITENTRVSYPLTHKEEYCRKVIKEIILKIFFF